MKHDGATRWYFPDGYLPEKKPGEAMEAHESLMLFNPQEEVAVIGIDLYFSDREPIKGIAVEVPAERVVALRLDWPEDLGGVQIPPLTQYAVRVRASLPIIAQMGRLDTAQPNLAYYGTMGHAG